MSLTLAIFFTLILLFRHASASEEEIRSLLEFKKGIKSDPTNSVYSTWIFPANTSACPEAFHGVTCDPVTESVVSIALDFLGLTGDLKFNTLVPLKSLQNLTLAGNLLTGRLVPTLGIMSSLQVIDLSGNQLYGPIPSKFHDLWALHQVNLSNNNFSGWFPAGIRNLQQMKVLDLHSNQLKGDLVELISELRNVEYLDLSGNGFFGSVELSVENLSSLANTAKYVNLSGNGLGGGFWEIGVMSLFRNLEVLDLGNNGIAGELPDLGQLPNLHVLRLGGNMLNGKLPDGILQGNVPLVELDLSGNGFSGPIPLINSTTLVKLNLSSNSISDDISTLTNWTANFEMLDLSSNSLSGTIPNLTQFQELNWLSFASNQLNGLIPFTLFTSPSLKHLNLSRNRLTGPIPLEGSHSQELLVLPSVPQIESLDLSNNLLSGILPSDIGNLGRLKSLNLASNDLSGPLPNELSKLTLLEYLNLSHNKFNGQIPDKLPSTLKFLDLGYNNLSGKIPENLNHFPDSSFLGNSLDPRHGLHPTNDADRHRSKSSIRIAIIVASIGAAIMIAFVLLAYHRARLKDFNVRSRFCGQNTERDIKVGRFTSPSLFGFQNYTEPPSSSSLSFSHDHLLNPNSNSNSRSPSGQVDLGTEIIEQPSTSGKKSSPGSPIASAPHFIDQSVPLDVYSPDRLAGDLFFLDSSLKFTGEELSRAPAEVLGRSSHGTLYKATLDNGHVLTVKWLRVGLVKDKKEFAKEVKKIGSVRHSNVVPIRAYYWGPREQERLVLADYVVGDSLALHLYETTPRRYPLLSFTQRLKVAVEVARGLMFLHDRNLPHGNLKPTNILLDGPDFTARISDYSLHRLMTPAGVSEQMLNLGALGYRAPELATSAKPVPSLKSDVYALGVILMELLTRRSAGDIISGQSGAVDLTDWVRLCDNEGRGLDCIDRDISGGEEEHTKAMDEMLGVSLRCIRAVNERPNIRQVLDDLCSIAV